MNETPHTSSDKSTADFILQQFDEDLGAARRLRLPRLLIYGCTLITCSILFWASIAEVDQVVRATGRAIPAGKPQIVQHFEGGMVSKLYVREGQFVKVGQPMVAVSDLLANSSRGEKRARLNGLLAKSARLMAESEGAFNFTVPASLSKAAPEVLTETAVFEARRARLKQTVNVYEEQLAQKRQESIEMRARSSGLSAELDVARKQLALVSKLVSNKAGSQLELLEQQSRVERLSTQMRETEASLPRLSSAASELTAKIAETHANYRSEARSLQADTQIELGRLQQELQGDDDRVRRTVVVAPVSGTVNKLMVNTLGGVVRPGDPLVELTPSDESVVIEARVLPADRGALKALDRAVVRVAAFDYTVFGTLAAVVNDISPDTLVDERGERFFRVVVIVDPSSYKNFGQIISPGMTATADVVIGHRTVMQYLLSPIRGIASSSFRERK